MSIQWVSFRNRPRWSRFTSRRLGSLVAVALGVIGAARADEVWPLDNVSQIAGHAVSPVGHPVTIAGVAGNALRFDGAHDGLFVPAIPIAGASQFTLEVLFSPAPQGPEAQRFFHVQDEKGSRALMEIRTNGKDWWLDAFLRADMTAKGKGLTLIDPKRVHPTGKWYWVALRYDGHTMTDFVNGQKELQGEVDFPPLAQGKVSIGVRQNLVYWFKGAIQEVRFHGAAVSDDQLQRVPESK